MLAANRGCHLERIDLATGKITKTVTTPASKALAGIPMGIALVNNTVVSVNLDPATTTILSFLNASSGAVTRTETRAALGFHFGTNIAPEKGFFFLAVIKNATSTFALAEISASTGDLLRVLSLAAPAHNVPFAQSGSTFWLLTSAATTTP